MREEIRNHCKELPQNVLVHVSTQTRFATFTHLAEEKIRGAASFQETNTLIQALHLLNEVLILKRHHKVVLCHSEQLLMLEL